MSVRVIICGSREFPDPFHVLLEIDKRVKALPAGTTVVHGAANGTDQIAAEAAERAGLKVEAHPADWARLGRRAGVVRNEEMAAAGADLCIAFWDGTSRGMSHMMSAAMERGIPVELILAVQ